MKIEAQDARAEADHLQKLLRQSEENATESRIRLNEERARHAETADQVSFDTEFYLSNFNVTLGSSADTCSGSAPK